MAPRTGTMADIGQSGVSETEAAASRAEVLVRHLRLWLQGRRPGRGPPRGRCPILADIGHARADLSALRARGVIDAIAQFKRSCDISGRSSCTTGTASPPDATITKGSENAASLLLRHQKEALACTVFEFLSTVITSVCVHAASSRRRRVHRCFSGEGD